MWKLRAHVPRSNGAPPGRTAADTVATYYTYASSGIAVKQKLIYRLINIIVSNTRMYEDRNRPMAAEYQKTRPGKEKLCDPRRCYPCLPQRGGGGCGIGEPHNLDVRMYILR